MADAVERLVADVPTIKFERYFGAPHIVNLVMRVRGARPGRRLIFNGQMDTFPLFNAGQWTADPASEVRVGASDARLYRRAGVPTVVCGLTPYDMGSADEYVDVAELLAVGDIFALTAFDFLNAT
jgi:acetylornithine deacetylase/succinyl-diaminopimelate desuccinylase-like protein